MLLELHAQVGTRFRVFDGRVSIEDCLVLNDMVIDKYCPGVFLEGKSKKLLTRIAHVPPEIRNGHLPNTSLRHHRYGNLLGKTHLFESFSFTTAERAGHCAVNVS